MKTKLVLIAVACLLLFAANGMTQQAPLQEDWRTLMEQEAQRAMLKNTIRSFWYGQGAIVMVAPFLHDPDIRAAWDISDEQFQQIRDSQKSPEVQEMMLEMQSLLRNPDDPLMQNADEETMRRFFELQEIIVSMNVSEAVAVMENNLTADQKEKINESLLASMSEIPLVSLDMFEVLVLTDVQRQQMREIQKELEPEFEKNLEKTVDATIILQNKFETEIEKQGGFANITSHEDMREKVQAIARKLMAEDPEFKRLQDETHSLGQAFSTQFRTRMFDVLTDEQWFRLQDLIDNPPDYAAVLRKKLREQRGESVDAEEASDVWMPGPGSWRPGDAIPEAYRIERNTRRQFPRGE